MSATSRMLGRWRSGGCGCKVPGPDCAGHERDTRQRKRQEERAVRREIREGVEERTSQLMDYGPDWPPAPPRPSSRARGRMSLGERCCWVVLTYVLIAVVGLLALHVRQGQLDARTPIDGAGSSVTTTPGPHPATARRHP